MKLFLKILAGVIILITVVIVGLNLYFTDERLKSMILPEVREAVGTDVQVESMSLTFFRTFPSMGVELNEFILPDPEGNPIATLEELLVGVELFPLLQDEISISELILNKPVLNYHVYQDSTSNIDFLLELGEGEEAADEEGGYSINIPQFTIESATVNYRDDTGNMFVELKELDADISLQFSDLIESRVNAELGSLSAMVDSSNYVENLALSLNQTSTIDLENEQLNLTEGTLSIRGLALNLNGTISNWSSEAPMLDLQFSSSSENFGELLRLAPPEYDEYLSELESRGALVLEGSVSGSYTEESLPDFDLLLNVEDGYLKNPDLPEAIENIRIVLKATNELVTIEDFSATAAENTIDASGSIERPLEEDAVFNITFDGDVNLATISQFYPIEEFGIQSLNGILAANATANGNLSSPENAEFSGVFTLRDGMLQYEDVPQAIRQINANVQADQSRITIENVEFNATENSFSMSGTVSNPLDEKNRNINLNADLDFDLATIKDFYPIDEDTLTLRGQLNAKVNLRGKADPDNIEQLLQSSTFTLRNGFISHESIGKPLEDITMTAEANGSRLTIREARFKTGENSLAVNGTVTDYLSENPRFNLNVDGDAVLGDVSAYYSLEPWIQELSGKANLDLRATGPAGDPQKIQLNGALQLSNVQASGDSLPLPVRDLNGTFSVTPRAASVKNFRMKFGSSDINLNGEMRNYLGMLNENPGAAERPNITGSYSSNLLDLDEMIDWDAESEESEEPILIELPEMNAAVDAKIKRLVIFGIDITEISGKANMNPVQIRLDNTKAQLFDGTAAGNLVWDVPRPDQTRMTFNGSLSNLTAEAFFRETGFLGKNSNIHEYLNGALSAKVNYSSTLNQLMEPVMSTTKADGSFGMSRARLAHHPIQEKIADLLKVNELSTLALDSWEATFTIANEVMTFKDFNLTSEDIGLELDGTLHLTNEKINFNATLSLPARFKKGISSILPDRAADALQREDGTIAVPLKITGTMSNPQVREDDAIIKKVVEDYLKEQGGKLLDRIFGDN